MAFTCEDGSDAEEKLKAIRILQELLGRCGQGDAEPACVSKFAVETSPGPDLLTPAACSACPVHELSVEFDALPEPIRILEAVDSEEATRCYRSIGEEDPFGAKAWPSAYICAQRLFAEGVRGRSVLELGCGTGLVSLAAARGGASFVLATDRCQANVDRALASARLNSVELHGDVFDVNLPQSLPAPIAAGDRRHNAFDFVVFSDVLYWEREAVAFGRRAAEAHWMGSTVIVADPGRRREDFLGALRAELRRRLGPDAMLPPLNLEQTHCPEKVYEWVSAEVRTASSLFCEAPFELVIRQRGSDGPMPAPCKQVGGRGPCRDGPLLLPTYYEPVD